jgi:methylmalonyl-CoA mutase
LVVQIPAWLSGRLADFREGLCQLVATAWLPRASEKSQLMLVRDFTERHSELAHAALSAVQDAARSGRDVFAAAMGAARTRRLRQVTEAFFEVGGQYRRNI